MPVVCIQCALEGFVRASGQLEPGYGNFGDLMQSFGVVEDATSEAHIARVHPNGVNPATRKELEAQVAAILLRQQEE